MTLLPLETVYTFSIKENGKSFLRWWKTGSTFIFFFLFYSIEEFFITLSIKLKGSSISESSDINEDDRVDLIGINSPEIDEIRRCSRTRMERNVNKIIAIKPKATRWIESWSQTRKVGGVVSLGIIPMAVESYECTNFLS